MKLVTKFFDCVCTLPEHACRFAFWQDDDDKKDSELYLDIQLRHYLNFWKRLRVAWNYLLGKPVDNACWDTIVFKPEDIENLLKFFVEAHFKMNVTEESQEIESVSILIKPKAAIETIEIEIEGVIEKYNEDSYINESAQDKPVSESVQEEQPQEEQPPHEEVVQEALDQLFDNTVQTEAPAQIAEVMWDDTSLADMVNSPKAGNHDVGETEEVISEVPLETTVEETVEEEKNKEVSGEQEAINILKNLG